MPTIYSGGSLARRLPLEQPEGTNEPDDASDDAEEDDPAADNASGVFLPALIEEFIMDGSVVLDDGGPSGAGGRLHASLTLP